MMRFVSFCSFFILLGCSVSDKSHKILPTYDISLEWNLDSIQVSPSALSFISLKIINNGELDMTSNNWMLGFNHMNGNLENLTESTQFNYNHLEGDYYNIEPLDEFADLGKGQSITITYAVRGIISRASLAPNGFFIVINDQPGYISEVTISGITENTLATLNPPSAIDRFKENSSLQLIDRQKLSLLVPSPSIVQQKDGFYSPNGPIHISYDPTLVNEGQLLLEKLGIVYTGEIFINNNADGNILLSLDSSRFSKEEAYQLDIKSTGIHIVGATPSGVFYGIQSLINLLDPKITKREPSTLSWPLVHISDAPRFGYRGLHLDVSRNFHTYDQVLKILDLMSMYKLNKFHFHLTDDEGWRLEIPSLPELTEIGSKRGYTIDETDHLNPAYGSGPDPDHSKGSGYYSRDEFIKILRFASQRHIEVIPEIDAPGHARAAIKSMYSRYLKLMEQGKEEEAKEFLLHDIDDESSYNTAQNYTDNVMCICREGTFNFMNLVFSEVKKMYEDAGLTLSMIHTGGDEIPFGAWEKSPICQKFLKSKPELKNTSDLLTFFLNKMRTNLYSHKIGTAGWEEIVLVHGKEGHEGTQINLKMIGQNVIPYVWNATWGWGREDMAYKLANAGFSIIMCNSSAFYFDMAYNKNPEEIGLSWSGFADTKTAFETEPLNIFKRAKTDVNGQALDPEYIAGKIRLTPEGEKNFLGVQGQLWSETITDDSKIYYLLFPKMLAFAERAWSQKPTWIDIEDERTSNVEFNESWNLFCNTLGQKELQRLDNLFGGIPYRIAMPGAMIKNDTLYANIRFPGLEIRYTINQSSPDANSKKYSRPVYVGNSEVRLATFNSSGRRSKVSICKKN